MVIRHIVKKIDYGYRYGYSNDYDNRYGYSNGYDNRCGYSNI